ncbi:hypothetical protein GO986_00830 [Deinococcus sp. HMF7620]|uniref:PD(D/E)XK endonuclease domain-containing protein n=1 Tax=Deinococcus arboris TaxID=2682977 RepID=A0A7C9HXE2_9DEIO|nr:hypothetical protein [Deinococcus arboris]MVN85315.1 hypothetical protein [Deinococcus arboris]
MNHKNIDLSQLAAAHARGLKDNELAQHFGLSLSSIKRRKKALNLGSNHQPNSTGTLGERLVAEHLVTLGLTVHVMPPGSPYDLLVNGWRVDVKTSATSRHGEGRHFRYVLPEVRPSFHGQHLYAKDYAADANFLLLVVLQNERLSAAYVVPVAERQASLTVHPESPFCPLAPYRSAWHLLTPAQQRTG